MAYANREQILDDIRKAVGAISRIESKLESQGYRLSHDNKEHGQYYDIEQGGWEYSRELENAHNYKRISERALEDWDEKYSSGEISNFVWGQDEEIIYEQSEYSYESSTLLGELSEFSEFVVDKIVWKTLKKLGFLLKEEFSNTSKEGRIGAVALGGTALGLSLADGQIDSLEALGILGLSWIGMKLGEAVTPAESFFANGISKIEGGNIDGAINDFGKAIGKDRSYCNAYFQRGCLYSISGRIKQALSDFNKTIELNPEHPLAYTKRASINYALKKYEDAVRDFTIAIKKEPNYEHYYMRALSYSATKHYNESYKDLTCAIQYNSKEPLAYLLRGCILLDCQRKVSEAMKDFNRALQLAPTLAEAYLCQARALFERKNIKSSIQYYTKAVKFGDKEIKLKALSGRCLAYVESNKIWRARFDAFESGTKHPALKVKTGELIAYFGLITIVPTAFLVNSLTTFISQDIKTETIATVEPESSTSNELNNPNQNSKLQDNQLLLTECNRFSLAMQSATEVQTAFSSQANISDIDTSITSIEKIIKANSAFSDSLSNLSLQHEQLVAVQKGFIDLSGDIYMNQYHKIQALKQLKQSKTSAETNMLSSLYTELNRKDSNFNSRYVSLLDDFNTVCGISDK